MEVLVGPLVAKLLTLGGGYVLAAVLLVLYVLERKQTSALADSKDKLYDKLFAISEKQTEALTRVNSVLEHNDKTLDNVNGTLNALASDNRRRR